MSKVCSVDGCVNKHHGRGYCSKHYQRWKNTGLTRLKTKTPEERFWKKVGKSGDCWEWLAATGGGKNKYGVFCLNGKQIQATHAVLEIEGVDVPSGMIVCHTCDNPTCVNPDHLFIGTHSDNTQDMLAKGRHGGQKKTHCPHGHELAGENIYWTHRGTRTCRACRNKKNSEYQKRRRRALKCG